MRIRTLRLKTIFVILLLSIATVPLVLTAIGTEVLFERDTNAKALADVRLFSLSVSEALDVFFDPFLQALSEIVYFVAQENYDEEVIKRLLTIKLVSRSQFKSYFALDRFGTVKFTIPRDPEREGVSLSGYEFFVKRSYDGYVRLSLPFASPYDGSMSLAAYTSYDDRTFVGLVDFGRVESMLRKFTLLPEATVIITDRNGTVLASTRYAMAEEKRNFRDFPPVKAALEGDFGSSEAKFEGKQSVCGTAVGNKTGWIILVVQPISALNEALVMSRRVYVGIFGIGIFVSLLVSFALYRAFLRPFEMLRLTIRAIAEGRAEPGGSKSFGFLDLDDMMSDVSIMAGSIRSREEDLRDSREFLHTTLKSIGEGVVVTDPEGRISFMNPEAERLTGRSIADGAGKSVRDVVKIEETGAGGKPRDFLENPAVENDSAGTLPDFRLLVGGDRRIPVECTVAPIRDPEGKLLGSVLVFRDITERRNQELSIQRSLEEKESLLKEIHHRVKNNLQVINSLLGLQEYKVKNKEFSSLIQESQNRIRTMALVHEKIYRSESLAAIDLGEYLSELGEFLFHAYFSEKQKVVFKHDTESVVVSIDVAVTCGLLINEIITNSLKHAFPDGWKEGTVFISLRKTEDNLEITAGDDGQGISDGVDHLASDSLGMSLIYSLSQQLKAELDTCFVSGTRYTLLIPLKPKDEE